MKIVIANKINKHHCALLPSKRKFLNLCNIIDSNTTCFAYYQSFKTNIKKVEFIYSHSGKASDYNPHQSK